MAAMRLLLIDDDPRYRALLRHHVSCDWTDAEIVAYNPVVRGKLHPEFLAQGFDAVLLDHSWPGQAGIEWLRELKSRTGFAPIIFLAAADDSAMSDDARAAGAFDIVNKGKLDHDRLMKVVAAARLAQQAAQIAWRGSSGAREAQTFGGAYIKGYRRVRQLASGSVSDLFLAESVQAGALVVFKVTRDVRKTDGIDQSFSRFLQEYEIVRSIRHPNVVHILDLGVTDHYAYLVMEYFSRGDLRAQMRQALEPRRALGYALEIARALEAIHAAGILHRDLKPGNVMLRDDGSLALIDFGLAKHRALEMEITDKGMIFGTPHYMSPEQGHGRKVDARADIYALGIMLYEMLTGTKPFNADNPMTIIYKHARRPVPALPENLQQFTALLAGLLAKKPEDRYADAGIAAAAIATALQTLGSTPAPA